MDITLWNREPCTTTYTILMSKVTLPSTSQCNLCYSYPLTLTASTSSILAVLTNAGTKIPVDLSHWRPNPGLWNIWLWFAGFIHPRRFSLFHSLFHHHRHHRRLRGSFAHIFYFISLCTAFPRSIAGGVLLFLALDSIPSCPVQILSYIPLPFSPLGNLR